MSPLAIEEFLSESNAIEGVHDKHSFQDAENAWRYIIGERAITPSVIKHTHKILMERQKLDRKYVGQFRDCTVYVGDRECSPLLLEKRIATWCKDISKAPADSWKALHVAYERIHPFIDGNGRTGRMFMNWHRLKFGLPLLVIHVGREQREYYTWFQY